MSPDPFRMPAFGALRAFEAVARLGTLSRAAEALSVTKSAVSHQLRALETDLGAVLLYRGNGRSEAVLTEQGQRLFVSVQQAMAVLDTACRDVRAHASAHRARVLRLSVNASLASLWLAPRIGRFSARHPDIQIQVHLHVLQPDWIGERIDLAILHSHATQPLLSGDVRILTETVVPVCSPDLIPPSLRNDASVLLKHRLIQEEHIESPETDWSNWGRRLGLSALRRSDILQVAGMSTVVGMAASGFGIGLGRSPLIDEALESGRLVALLPAHRQIGSWGYTMRIAPNVQVDPPLQALMAFLESEGGTGVQADPA